MRRIDMTMNRLILSREKIISKFSIKVKFSPPLTSAYFDFNETMERNNIIVNKIMIISCFVDPEDCIVCCSVGVWWWSVNNLISTAEETEPSLSLCAPLSCWLQTGDIQQSTLPCFLYSDNSQPHTTHQAGHGALGVVVGGVEVGLALAGGQCSAAVTSPDNGPGRPGRTQRGHWLVDNAGTIDQ